RGRAPTAPRRFAFLVGHDGPPPAVHTRRVPRPAGGERTPFWQIDHGPLVGVTCAAGRPVHRDPRAGCCGAGPGGWGRSEVVRRGYERRSTAWTRASSSSAAKGRTM